VREPLTLGHESAGVVVDVGSGVSTLKKGDRVALEVGQPCEVCDLCRSGRYNICRDMKFRSSAKAVPHAQGTLQDVIAHPAKWCHRLPDPVSLELGALAEPLAVAIHASDRAKLPAASAVLVLGAGAVGLLCAAVAKAVAGSKVVIADIQAERVKFAVDHGFADAGVVVPLSHPRPTTIEEKLDAAKKLADLLKNTRIGDGHVGEVAATFECTGVESCLQAAIYVSLSSFHLQHKE